MLMVYCKFGFVLGVCQCAMTSLTGELDMWGANSNVAPRASSARCLLQNCSPLTRHVAFSLWRQDSADLSRTGWRESGIPSATQALCSSPYPAAHPMPSTCVYRHRPPVLASVGPRPTPFARAPPRVHSSRKQVVARYQGRR